MKTDKSTACSNREYAAINAAAPQQVCSTSPTDDLMTGNKWQNGSVPPCGQLWRRDANASIHHVGRSCRHRAGRRQLLFNSRGSL